MSTAVKKADKKADARERDVHKATSRWPVTVAAVLAILAVVLAVFLVLRRHENDVVSFQGSPTEVVIDSSAGLVIVVPADGNQVQVSRRAKWTLFKPDMSVGVEGGSLVVKADCVGPSFICDVQYRVVGAEHGVSARRRRSGERADRRHRRQGRRADLER